MTSSHTKKENRRYRYYRTREASDAEPAWWVGAHDIEQLVQQKLGDLLSDHDHIARLAVTVDPHRVEHIVARARSLATGDSLLPSLVLFGVERINLHAGHLDIHIKERDLLRACGLGVDPDHAGHISISAPVRKVRQGHDIRLVIQGEETAPQQPSTPDDALVSLIAEALEVREQILATPDQAISTIAASLGKCRKRITKLLHIAWMAPDIIRAIIEGTQPPALTAKTLLTIDLPLRWDEQKTALGFI